MSSSKTVIAKQIQNDQPTDVLVQTIPQIFNLKELAQFFVTKPLSIDGEQLYFKTIDDNQILLANDFNKRISRACISIWEDKQLMVMTAVTKELRNCNYCTVCSSLLKALQQEAQTKEETVMFHGSKIGFIKKLNKRKLSQHTCIVLLNYNQEAGDDVYNQPGVQLVKAIHATCQAYKDLLYTVYAFNNTTTQIIDDLANTFFYMDKINILDNTNDALENSFPEQGKLCEIYIFNQGEEQVQQISIGEVSELKKLQIDLHQRLVNMSFIKLTSPEMNYLDLTEDKRLSIDGFAFPYVQRMYKYSRQPVLIVKENDPGIVEQYQKLCKQFNTYLIVQGNGNPEDYKNITMVKELPYVIKASKFIYSDGIKPRFLKSFQQFIPLAQAFQQTVQSLQDETQDELEVDEAQLPELRFATDEKGATIGMVFRGYNFNFIQQPAPFKEKQFQALVFIDSSQPDFEYQLERAYLLQNKCPEIYMAFIIRGITSELYLRQKMTRTILLNKLNILQYKSGFIKALRKFEPKLQHMIYFYDQKMRFYGRQFSLIEALEQYKDILEDLTNQTIYSERRTAKQFFYNTPAINQYVFQGQILKSVNVAKPYLKQALIALFFIAPNKHPKTGQVCEQDLVYDLNQALDCQKSGLCFVLVCVEGVSIANISSYMEKYPVLKQLNVLGDKDVISKIRFVNRVTSNEGRNYYIIDQIANKIQRFSSSAMICTQLEHEENNNNFLHDDTNSVENVIYNDLVFTYVQRVRQRHQQQGLCLIYLDPADQDKLALNVQRVCALQDKYPEVSFDISIIGVDDNGFKPENFESVYYFDRLNVVGDAPDTHSIIMNRADFSYYLYNNNFEFLKKNVGQTQLDQDLTAYVNAIEPRVSFFDEAITENDKAVIMGGYYMPYLRRVQHKNAVKTLVIFILDSSDDRYGGYLKQIDTVRRNYPELYVVVLVSGLVRETYVGALEAFPVLNKCNIIAADNGVAEKYLSQHPGKPLLALLQDDVHDDFLKFTQVLDERFTEKEVITPQEIIFKGQKCQYLQQVFERHRKQAVLICCIPKDEQVESRVQQIYQLQTIYPEVYFVYYIEQTDIVSIQAYKRTVFKFPHINIIKNVIMEGKGLQFYLLNSKFEQKQRMKTFAHLKQELRKLQFDLNQARECVVPCIDCQLEDRINYYGRTLEYYRKNYRNEDQNVGIIFAVLDPDSPVFAADCEALNSLRKQALKYAYVLVSLRNCTFERARDIINADVNLMELNVVASVPEFLEQGTSTQRFELHSHMLIQRSDVRLFDSLDALQAEILRDGFIQHDDVSDVECALDAERSGDAFYADTGKPETVIFRGTELQIIQQADSFKHGDSVIFTYIDDIDDVFSVEQRIKVQYELMHAFPGHFSLICIRGITNTTQLNQIDRAHYLREVTILAYKSGFSRMFSQAEKEQKMCSFYFQPKVEAVENRRVTRFVPARLDTLATQERHKYVASLIPEMPTEQQMVVNGFRHNYVQKIAEYNVKFRYIITIYCVPEQITAVTEGLGDLISTRDDVYVAVAVQGIQDTTTLTQIGGTNLKELNVIDDANACQRAFSWYQGEYRRFYETKMAAYRHQLDRFERLRQIRADIESEEERQEFTEKYGVIEPRDPKLSRVPGLIVLTQDASYAQNCKVSFEIPSICTFTDVHGSSAKQLEAEKDKVAGATLKIESVEFDIIQKQIATSQADIKHNVLVFLNTQHPNFALEVSNLYQLAKQSPRVMLAVCLIGVKQLNQEHFSLAHNLQNLNIVADRPMKYAKEHMTYYVTLPNGELLQNLGQPPIAQLQLFSKVTEQPRRYDVKGDKQVLFNGAIYTFLRRILFKSASGAALFAFIKSDNEVFEAFVKQLHDAQLKFPEVAVILFIEGVAKADLKELLQKFPALHNVNIAEDRDSLVKNMLSRSSTGITFVGWNGRDKDVQLDDTAKLDATIASFGYKPLSVKAEEKIVLKTKQDQSVTFTYVQKLYQRRGTSPNAAFNQRVCLCLIPPDGKYYNDRMIFYTYAMQVRFPEIYFVIAFPGLTKDQVTDMQTKFNFLSEMNVVESPQAATLLHECGRNDVDNEGLPEAALGQKIFTYRLFDGVCKEDTDVSGTPQDEIFAEFVVDKYSTREHLKYLAPSILVLPDRLVFKGYNMALINKSNLSKYAPEKPVVFVKLVQNEKIDLVCKQFVELMRQKQDVYFIFNIERVAKEQLKAFIQTHPQIKLLNIVHCAAQDDLYPVTADIGQNKGVAVDFNLVMQLPSFDFYDNFYAQLYGAEQLPVSQKAQILASFIEKIQSEFEMNQNFQQNAANLDIEPPARPAQAEGEEEVVDEAKYEYYDQLVVCENVVYFRYYELPFLQKGPEFEEFRKKQKYCLVTASRQCQYEANFFEKTIREIYLQSQEHTDIGYMVVIENLYDTANLFKLSQQAYYLNQLVVLAYKFGFNQLLRAPGEFVCDRIVMREMIFNRVNRFYYERKDGTQDDKVSMYAKLAAGMGGQSADSSNGSSGNYIVCRTLTHSVNKDYALCEQNDGTKLLLDTPNSNYLVLYGAAYRILRRPDSNFAAVQNKKKSLFVFIIEENPAILDMVTDAARKLKCAVYVIAAGVTAENVNGFSKKHKLCQLATVLSDEGKTVPRVAKYAKKLHGIDNQVILLKINAENEAETAAVWSDKFDDIDMSVTFRQEPVEPDGWWNSGTDDTTLV